MAKPTPAPTGSKRAKRTQASLRKQVQRKGRLASGLAGRGGYSYRRDRGLRD